MLISATTYPEVRLLLLDQPTTLHLANESVGPLR